MIDEKLIADIRRASTVFPIEGEHMEDKAVIDLSGDARMLTRKDIALESRDGAKEIPAGTPLRISINKQIAEEIRVEFERTFKNLPAPIVHVLWPKGTLRRFKKGLSFLDFTKMLPDVVTSLQAAALGEFFGIWNITRPTFEDWLIEGVAGEKFIYHLKG